MVPIAGGGFALIQLIPGTGRRGRSKKTKQLPTIIKKFRHLRNRCQVRADTGCMKNPHLRLMSNPTPKHPVEPMLLPTRRPRRAAPQETICAPAPVSLVPVIAETHSALPKPIALEDAIIAALDAPAEPHERPSEVFRRKELAVGELFAALSIIDAYVLHKRLSVRQAGDPIASRFGRLVADRQQRLMEFLGDARRRAAFARSR